MGPSARALTAAATLLLAGCDTLFPEFGGSSKPADMALVDGGTADGGDTSPRLAGVVCVLTDLRDYRSCAITTTGVLRVTVEETREQAMTDPTGHFTLPLSKKLEVATVAAVDPNNNFPPTIMPIRLDKNGVATSVALPVAPTMALSNAALQNGMNMDPLRGTLLGWVIDTAGTPLANVAATGGAFYDDASANQISAGSGTRGRGTVALFDVSPTSLTLTLTPPATAAVRADTFTIPIRAGALTATTLVLPPR